MSDYGNPVYPKCPFCGYPAVNFKWLLGHMFECYYANKYMKGWVH